MLLSTDLKTEILDYSIYYLIIKCILVFIKL